MARKRTRRPGLRRTSTAEKVIWVIFGLLVVLSATMVVILTSTNIVEEQVRSIILEQASKQLDAKVSIARVELNYLPLRIIAHDVKVDHPTEGRFVEAESLEIEVEVTSLVTDDIRLTEVAVIRPEVEIRIEEGRVVNLPRARKKTKKGPTVILESLNISSGKVEVNAVQTAPWPLSMSVGNLNVDITGEENELFEVRLLAGRGGVQAGDVQRSLDRLDLRATLDTRRTKLESRLKYVNLEMLDVVLSVEDGHFELSEDNAIRSSGEFRLAAPLYIASELASSIPALKGSIDCGGSGSYEPGAWEADATCAGREIRVGKSFIGDVDVHVEADQDEIVVDEGSVRQAGGELKFSAWLSLASESKDIQFKGEADGLRFAELATNVGLKRTRVQFSVRGPIEASGTLSPLDVEGEMDWTVNGFKVGTRRYRQGFGPDLLSVGPGRIRSKIAVDDSAFRFENAHVTTGTTSLRTTVSIGFDNDLRVKVDSSRMNLKDVKMPGVGLRGTGSLHVIIDGSLKRTGRSIKVDSRLDFKGLEIAGVIFGKVRSRLRSDTRKGIIDVSNAVGSLGSSRYRIPQARVTFRPRGRGGILIEGEVEADGFHIPDARRAFDMKDIYTREAMGVFSGDVSFSVEPKRRPGKLMIDAVGDVEGLQLFGQTVGGGSVSVRYETGRYELREVELTDGTGTFSVRGVADPASELTLDIHVHGFESSRIAAVDMDGLGLEFIADLDGHVGGTWDVPHIDGGMLVVRDLVYQDQTLGQSAIQIDLEDRMLSLAGPIADGMVTFESTTVTQGRWPTAVQVGLEDLLLTEGPLGVADSTEARAKITGDVEASLRLAEGFEAQGRLQLESILIQVPDYGIHNDGTIEASFTQDALYMDHVDFVGEGTSIRITGSVQKKGPRLQIGGQADLTLLSRVAPQILKAQGTLSPRVAIEGSWDAVDVAGELDVDCKKLVIKGFPVKIANVLGEATFKQNTMILDAQGNVAGGTFNASGGIRMDGFRPAGYDVYADFNDVTLKLVAGIPMGVEGRLALQGGAEGEIPVLSGDVWVTRFRYTEDIKLASIEDIGVVKPLSPVKTYDEEDDHVQLDVVLHGFENLEVVNNVAEVDFRIDETQRQFRLVGTDSRPLLSGSIMVTRGTVFYQKKSFEVTRGVLDFNSSTRIDPDIDIIAVGEVREWRLTLQATGTYRDLKVLLNSDPPLSDEDIVCLLATDMTCEEAAEGLGFIGALGLNEILGQFASIEQFKVVPVYDPDTGKAEPMVLLKQKVTEKISISALSSLGSNEESGQSAYLKAAVAYKVNDNLSIEGFYDTKGAGKGTNMGNVGLELSWRLEF